MTLLSFALWPVMSLTEVLTFTTQLNHACHHLLERSDWSGRALVDLQAVQRNAQRLEGSLRRAVTDQRIPEYDQWVHELRNPLNVVIGYTEIWLEDHHQLNADQQRELQDFHHQVIQLADLIAALLDLED